MMLMRQIGNLEDQLPEVNEYWCWRSSTCHGTRRDGVVCAKDIQIRKRVFKKFINQCSVFKRNCASRTGVSLLI
ncbi:hypothetical protein MSG28_011929 [Choristoneura fumiferana]|uniref:Uncharacterized protein n=1 Tax=Choristoneura fumiferana TaxID=7141 RepID=A0ACC0KNH3_CHOFU|nr:hypothetical protein MSG28_011929 [Choristoneura fumiferana]